MAGDHLGARGFARSVRVEAAGDVVAASDQGVQPRRIAADTRRRDANALRMTLLPVQLIAANGVNRRFAEHDRSRALRTDPEVTSVPGRAWCQPMPDARASATQLGTNRALGLSGHHQKDRVAARVGI